MNTLRSIFSSRTLNYLRQTGQNALVHTGTQSLDTPVNPPTTSLLNQNENKPNDEKFLIPKSILNACSLKANSLGPVPSTSTSVAKYNRVRKVNIVYRCKICNTRNSKEVSQAAYTSGVVILQCDGCSINHLIIDHLGWFASTKNKSFNEVLAENCDSVRIIKVNEKGELI